MKNKSPHYQAAQRFHDMVAYGQSKHTDKLANGGKPAADKIYSKATMETYIDAGTKFLRWARSEYNCRDIDAAQQYVPAYIHQRIADGLSAATIRQDAAALSKMYQSPVASWDVDLPTRSRDDVTLHRDLSTWDANLLRQYADATELILATGLRRCEVERLHPSDVTIDNDGHCIVHVAQGKGGKARDVVALTDAPYRLACAAQQCGRQTVAVMPSDHSTYPAHVLRALYARITYGCMADDVCPSNLSAELIQRLRDAGAAWAADALSDPHAVHDFDTDFAKQLYMGETRDPARVTADMDRTNGTYVCRGTRAGLVYDRAAVMYTSIALGHGRCDVCVQSYLDPR